MSLPPQLFHRLRREPLLEQCPSCNRIIYYAPPTAPSVQESDSKG
jgi:predicted  nucleic acid-binding Zn-ribbon protein